MLNAPASNRADSRRGTIVRLFRSAAAKLDAAAAMNFLAYETFGIHELHMTPGRYGLMELRSEFATDLDDADPETDCVEDEFRSVFAELRDWSGFVNALQEIRSLKSITSKAVQPWHGTGRVPAWNEPTWKD